MGIIDIDITQVPYSFEINLSGRIYTIAINYNVVYNFFTADLILNGVTLIKGEKLILNQFLFRDYAEDKDKNLNPNFPAELLYVSATDNSVKRCGYDELGTTVFLYYVDRDEVTT